MDQLLPELGLRRGAGGGGWLTLLESGLTGKSALLSSSRDSSPSPSGPRCPRRAGGGGDPPVGWGELLPQATFPWGWRRTVNRDPPGADLECRFLGSTGCGSFFPGPSPPSPQP